MVWVPYLADGSYIADGSIQATGGYDYSPLSNGGAMPTNVSICSNALLKIGDNPISSFDEATTAARLCSNLWTTVRDGVLRAHPWNCAVKRSTLAPKADPPAYGFSYAFTVPADFLRLLEADTLGDHKVEGRDILADENPLYIRYIFRNEDMNSYDTLLIDALTNRMAAELAYPITKSTTQQQACWALYSETLKLARAIDGQEDTPDALGDFPLLSVRG